MATDHAAPAEPNDRSVTVLVGLAIVAVMLLVYIGSNLERPNLYNHFVWQASAWLEGQTSIRYPVYAVNGVGPANDYFNDVQELVDADGIPIGRGMLPFPPLPAVVLLPFVAVFGLATNAQLLAAILGAFDVGLAFWMLGRLRIGSGVRVAVTVFFGLGTVMWYTAEKGTTWYFAHVVAVGLALVAVGLALGRDREAVDEALDDPPAPAGDAGGEAEAPFEGPGLVGRLAGLVDRRQVAVGLLFGLACTARLTVVLGAPFFVLVGSGGTWWRRGLSAAVGMAVPLATLAAYNVIATGHLFNPVYDYLYQAEALGYSFLGYDPSWSIEDVRYIPQNLTLMLVGPPDANPTSLDFGVQLCAASDSVRGWFDSSCPILIPRTVGMGLLWTSPAYLLGLPALLRFGRSRLVTGAVVAILLVALVNVMHFSQGWVQFGYRFSLDFAPFALILVALGLESLARRWPGPAIGLAGSLIAVSFLVNLWGVYWASVYGW
jgi:hypothetical protein